MTFDEMMHTRKSVRSYTSQPVSPQDLNAILEAGRIAPSASNQQDWHFVAVKNEALRRQLVPVCGGQAFVGQAPVVLVVCGTADRLMQCGQSTASVNCSIALTHMMLKATELGLGTCWLGAFNPQQVKTVLLLPDDFTVVAVMPVGYAAQPAVPTSRKPLADIATIKE